MSNMNIQAYIEKCKREFRQRFPDMYGILPNRVDLHGNKGQPVHSDAIKGFIESALLGLCEQLKKEIGGMNREYRKESITVYSEKQFEESLDRAKDIGFNAALDSFLHLLDYKIKE